MARRRPFGRLRRLPSGRWQARYTGPDGELRSAPMTFATKGDADRWVAEVQLRLARGSWTDPQAAEERFGQYATRWLEHRHDLKASTRELYAWLLRRYLLPALQDLPLGRISPTTVREWHARASAAGGPTPVRQSYALLRAILNTAVAEQALMRNPCLLRGAGGGASPERPVATLDQVTALADAVGPHYRALVLTAAWSGARWGELVAVTQDRLDLIRGRLRIDRQLVELEGGRLIWDTPKSAAGVRTVHLPPHLLPELLQHVEHLTPHSDLVFPNPVGEPLKRGTFRHAWVAAREAVGLPGLHFHDLRHTGNVLAAATGATTRDLMARFGHSSMRAALIYQHASEDRDAALAVALSDLASRASTDGARRGHAEEVVGEQAARPAPGASL